jgi:hypothetical protein
MNQASVDALIKAAANDGAVTLVFIVAIGAAVYLTIKVFLPLIKILQQLFDFMVRLNGRLTQAAIDHVVEGEKHRIEDTLLPEEVITTREKAAKQRRYYSKKRKKGND